MLAAIQTARRYPLDQIVKIPTSTRVTPEPSSNLSRLYDFRRTLFYGVAYVIVIAQLVNSARDYQIRV